MAERGSTGGQSNVGCAPADDGTHGGDSEYGSSDGGRTRRRADTDAGAPRPDAPALAVDGISKSFGDGDDAVVAVDDVSFAVDRGSVVGLLGPNGAGKTTLIKSILGTVVPDSGTVRLFGVDATSDRRTSGTSPRSAASTPTRSPPATTGFSTDSASRKRRTRPSGSSRGG